MVIISFAAILFLVKKMKCNIHKTYLLLLVIYNSTLAWSRQRTGEPEEIITKAIEKLGIHELNGKVLHFFSMESSLQKAQSERTVQPFYSFFNDIETWFDVDKNIIKTSGRSLSFGSGPGLATITIAVKGKAFMMRDTFAIALQAGGVDEMNVWRLLLDWQESKSLRTGKNEIFRNYERIVLIRDGAVGQEKLFINKQTGFPVKYDYWEKHYLWGQVHIEVLYDTSIRVGNSFVPSGIYRMIDGETKLYRSIGKCEVLEKDKAPDLAFPEKAPNPQVSFSMGTSLQLPPVDTVKISNNAYLLKNRFYTETVTLINNTVYLFNATLGEDRAKQDEEWIKKLFPGSHEVYVVMTDLAWPHISGVRYWVNRGAKIISHKMSEEFLRKVIQRKWTLETDELEKNPRRKDFKFIGIEKLYEMAGGKIKLFPLDGISSEGALVALLTAENFLWASDYVQTVTKPFVYATDVIGAMRREGFTPFKFAAEHIPLTDWKTLESVNKF